MLYFTQYYFFSLIFSQNNFCFSLYIKQPTVDFGHEDKKFKWKPLRFIDSHGNIVSWKLDSFKLE